MRFLKGRIEITKLFLALVAVVLLVYVVVSIIQQDNHSSKELQAHTQTLIEIQKAVNEIKANNAADHQQTVTYINCVLVGITNSSNQPQDLAIYHKCLTAAGLPEANQ